MTQVLKIEIGIVFSDPDEVVGSEAILNTRDEIILNARTEISKRINKNIPFNKICSLVIGDKIEGKKCPNSSSN